MNQHHLEYKYKNIMKITSFVQQICWLDTFRAMEAGTQTEPINALRDSVIRSSISTVNKERRKEGRPLLTATRVGDQVIVSCPAPAEEGQPTSLKK